MEKIRAKVIKAFNGAPDGEHHPVRFHPGDIIEGDLARVAIAQKLAEPTKEKAGEPKLDLKPEQTKEYKADAKA